MTPVLFLRLAAGLTFLFAAGHTMGGFDSWSPQGETPVLHSMKTFHFDVFGVSRTYWDFYFGFGLFISTLLFLEAAVLWQLGSIARTAPDHVRPIAASFLIASLAGTYVSWRYIFVVPALFSLACTACLALAVLTAGPRRARGNKD